MHVIVDYNVGNLMSVQQAFSRVGIKTVISKDPTIIAQATSLILPGVGAFAASMNALTTSNVLNAVLTHIKANKKTLGICLGMQMLFEASEEFGYHQGLGIFKGIIKKIPGSLKIPHMGWNSLTFTTSDPLFRYIKPNDDVYFVHSYYADAHVGVIATTTYGQPLPAIVRLGNVYGMQFHPEKSGDTGLKLLKGYGELA
jgi:imidazole glycerol-phosphate synthase subunit HisH